jgi:hypothetical protein
MPPAGFNTPAMAPTGFPPPSCLAYPTASNQYLNATLQGFELRGIYLGDLPDSLRSNTKALQEELAWRLRFRNVTPWEKLEFGNTWSGKHNAYLAFKTPNDAYWAIQALNNKIIDGSQISAQWHRYRGRHTKEGVLI